MISRIRPGLRACVPDSSSWSRVVATEVRGLLAELGGRGVAAIDIATALGCSVRSLYTWRVGGAEMPASKLLALRALVAEHVRSTGT